MENMDYNNYSYDQRNTENLIPEPSVRDFIGWLLIPAVLGFFTCGIGSLILLIVWAFNQNNRVRGNFAKAQLLVMIITFALGLIFYLVSGMTMMALFSST